MVVGIDEVGRGCLAGPVCVAAVALDVFHPDINDSKQLTAGKRIELARYIKQTAHLVGIGWASNAYIDSKGIIAALKDAALAALLPFGSQADLILLDGNHNYLDDERVVTLVDGDASVPLISAASIVAKVARDQFMSMAAQRFAGYGFEQHVGYATPAHKKALLTLGSSPVHRLSFGMLKGMQHVD
ncbi:MAG TPA: ribonuclease HII [Candidatus Acidoferrum sp.]|nr:ribonuclease HII [Candidatus Acidoferrum sp.]